MSSPFFASKRWIGTLSEYERRGLFLACAITLVTRLVFVGASLLHPPVAVEVDSFRYFSIANDPGFSRWFDMNDPAGYPILLKLTLSTLQSYAGILILQAILSTGTVFLLFVLGRGLVSEKWNRLSVLLASASPLSMFFSSQLMTETSFAFFFMLTAVLVVKRIQVPKQPFVLFFAGLSLGFATLIRPSSLVTIIILAAFLVYAVVIRTVRFSNAASFVAGCMILLVLYGTGLKIKYNFFGISAKGPTTLSIYYGEPIMHSAGYSQHFIDSTLAALPVAEQYLDQSRRDHIDGNTFAHAHSALFYALLREHPLDVLKVHFLGIAQMLAWSPIGLFQLSKHFHALPDNSQLQEMQFQSIFFPLVRLQLGKVTAILRQRVAETPLPFLAVWVVSTAVWFVVLLCSIFGMAILMLRLNRGHVGTEYWYLLAIIASYILLVPQVAAGSRFRMPIEPFLILCAMYFVQTLTERAATKHP